MLEPAFELLEFEPVLVEPALFDELELLDELFELFVFDDELEELLELLELLEPVFDPVEGRLVEVEPELLDVEVLGASTTELDEFELEALLLDELLLDEDDELELEATCEPSLT